MHRFVFVSCMHLCFVWFFHPSVVTLAPVTRSHARHQPHGASVVSRIRLAKYNREEPTWKPHHERLLPAIPRSPPELQQQQADIFKLQRPPFLTGPFVLPTSKFQGKRTIIILYFSKVAAASKSMKHTRATVLTGGQDENRMAANKKKNLSERNTIKIAGGPFQFMLRTMRVDLKNQLIAVQINQTRSNGVRPIYEDNDSHKPQLDLPPGVGRFRSCCGQGLSRCPHKTPTDSSIHNMTSIFREPRANSHSNNAPPINTQHTSVTGKTYQTAGSNRNNGGTTRSLVNLFVGLGELVERSHRVQTAVFNRSATPETFNNNPPHLLTKQLPKRQTLNYQDRLDKRTNDLRQEDTGITEVVPSRDIQTPTPPVLSGPLSVQTSPGQRHKTGEIKNASTAGMTTNRILNMETEREKMRNGPHKRGAKTPRHLKSLLKSRSQTTRRKRGTPRWSGRGGGRRHQVRLVRDQYSLAVNSNGTIYTTKEFGDSNGKTLKILSDVESKESVGQIVFFL